MQSICTRSQTCVHEAATLGFLLASMSLTAGITCMYMELIFPSLSILHIMKQSRVRTQIGSHATLRSVFFVGVCSREDHRDRKSAEAGG